MKEEDVMPIKGKERNGSKWKIGVVERLIQGQDGVIREAQLKAGKTHTERPLQLLYPLELTCNRPERTRGETLRDDVREFQPRRAASDDLGWLIVRSELLVSRRIKIVYIKPVWLFVARSFTTHKQRASTCELCQMRDVNKASPKMSGCRGNYLRVLAQVRDYDTFMIINFYLKLRFSE